MTKRSVHDLPPEVREKFLAASGRQDLAPRQELFGSGSVPRAMFGLVSGRVHVSIYSRDGQRFLAGQLTAGQWFGEVPLLDDDARAFSIEAIEPTEVAVLAAADFWKIVNEDSGAFLAITRLVCSRYRAALGWIEDASLKPLPSRLATHLLTIAGEKLHGQGELRLSQEALASHLGVARQTVNKQLKLWEREGLLQLRYASVQLLNLPALRRLAAATR